MKELTVFLCLLISLRTEPEGHNQALRMKKERTSLHQSPVTLKVSDGMLPICVTQARNLNFSLPLHESSHQIRNPIDFN